MKAAAAISIASLSLVTCSTPAPEERPGADAIFASICARCHGVDGWGGPRLDSGVRPRNFHDAEFQAQRTDADLRSAIVRGKNGNMPTFGDSFTDAELDALVARVRSFKPTE